MIKLILPTLTLLYIGAVTYMAIRYADILRNAKKYDRIPGYEKYEKSTWYWSASKDFGITDPPHDSRFTGLFYYIVVCAGLIIPATVFKNSTPPSDCLFSFRGWGEALIWWTSALIAAPLCYFIPMHLKSPESICFNIHYTFKGKSRSFAWKRITLYSLIAVAVFFPVYILSFFNNGYADDEKLVYSPFFSVEDEIFYYDDIVTAEPQFSENGVMEHCCIYNSDGDSIDLFMLYESDSDQLQNYVLERLGIDNST